MLLALDLIYIPIWFYFNAAGVAFCCAGFLFTFQYGSTSIDTPFKTDLRTATFTFQYGSTSIQQGLMELALEKIYIPIWFYFNRKALQPLKG